MQFNIRETRESDIAKLTDIFNHYVVNGHELLRLEEETVEQRLLDFRKKITGEGPYCSLVAEVDERVVGMTMSFKYRDGIVFERTVETGIILDPEIKGNGVGTKLYGALFKILDNTEAHLAVASIAIPNPASVALHKKMGFKEVGVFEDHAFMRGKYYSSICMQRRLGKGITST